MPYQTCHRVTPFASAPADRLPGLRTVGTADGGKGCLERHATRAEPGGGEQNHDEQAGIAGIRSETREVFFRSPVRFRSHRAPENRPSGSIPRLYGLGQSLPGGSASASLLLCQLRPSGQPVLNIFDDVEPGSSGAAQRQVVRDGSRVDAQRYCQRIACPHDGFRWNPHRGPSLSMVVAEPDFESFWYKNCAMCSPRAVWGSSEGTRYRGGLGSVRLCRVRRRTSRSDGALLRPLVFRSFVHAVPSVGSVGVTETYWRGFGFRYR